MARDQYRPLQPRWLRPSVMAFCIGSAAAIAAAYLLMRICMNMTSVDRDGYRHSSEVCGLLKHQEFVLFSKRVVTASGVIPASVRVKDGKIISIKETDHPHFDENVIFLDYGDRVIMPGFVDIHVHLNEPGREDWEGLTSGTRAAAAGGITTAVDMPLNSFPVTADMQSLQQKIEATKGKLSIDIGFWGGLIPENAENPSSLDELLKAGVLGLKSFMCPSGINDFPQTNAEHIKAALLVLAKHKRPLLVHAELPQVITSESPASTQATEEPLHVENPRVYVTYLKSRPPSWENAAIRQLIEVGASTKKGRDAEGASIHIVHLADAGSLPIIKDAKSHGINMTVETCTHYLAFSAEEILDGDTHFKCAPPIRNAKNQQLLWEALMDGTIDSLSSDHSPAPPEMKLMSEGDFMRAWGGISALQFGPMATWTHGKQRGVTLEQLAHWWSTRPAVLAGLTQKGSIEVGRDADFVVWIPEESTRIDDECKIYHKHKVTPFFNMTLDGRVDFTFVRGQLVFSEGTFSDVSCGKPILA